MGALPPKVLRRVSTLYFQVEGAQRVAQAAEAQFRTILDQYLTTLRAACEDADIDLPPPGADASLRVDWATGEVEVLMNPRANGVAV